MDSLKELETKRRQILKQLEKLRAEYSAVSSEIEERRYANWLKKNGWQQDEKLLLTPEFMQLIRARAQFSEFRGWNVGDVLTLGYFDFRRGMGQVNHPPTFSGTGNVPEDMLMRMRAAYQKQVSE